MTLRSLLLVGFILTSFSVLAENKRADVVYGEDNRVEPYERPLWWHHSRSVAAMIAKDNFSFETDLAYLLMKVPSHREDYKLCKGEKFSEQPILAYCTTFLVGPDVMMTAGHCIETMEDCRSYNFVFGFEMGQDGKAPKQIEKKNVYQCKSIIAQSYGVGANDYAIFKLDRVVTDRDPLVLLEPGKSAQKDDRVVMMGYPSGLPLKITENGQVLSLEKDKLVTNLDAFHVNSGSPVFDEKTGVVVGILVSGMPDYKPSPVSGQNCMLTNTLQEAAGQERVTSMGIVPRNLK